VSQDLLLFVQFVFQYDFKFNLLCFTPAQLALKAVFTLHQINLHKKFTKIGIFEFKFQSFIILRQTLHLIV